MTKINSKLGDYGVRKYDSFTGRFITPDVLFEKYAGWSPYHYSLDNPVSYKDGNGYEVIISYTTSDKYTIEFGKNVFNNLKNTPGRSMEIINSLEAKQDLFEIIITDHYHSLYDPTKKMILFNPNQFQTLDEGGTPEIMLGHELGHAIRDAEGRHKDSFKRDANGVKLEEIENIIENENPIRLQFQSDLEIYGFPIIRKSYNGKPIQLEDKIFQKEDNK